MRKRFFITLTLIIPVILIVVLVARESQFPPDAEDNLEQYLALVSRTSPPTVRKIVRAGSPRQFTKEMSAGSFGNSAYYITDNPYDEAGSSGYKSLQYPPQDIWCVTLEREKKLPTVILVALHTDLYNADWIVHEPNDPQQTLDAIGCKLTLKP